MVASASLKILASSLAEYWARSVLMVLAASFGVCFIEVVGATQLDLPEKLDEFPLHFFLLRCEFGIPG